jgi:hypothetical protein
MDPSGGAILEEIIAESGRTVGERITDFTRLATAVQADRWNRNVSDTERITRSDALWTLMELDGDIREALQQGGLDQGALGDILEVRGRPEAGR